MRIYVLRSLEAQLFISRLVAILQARAKKLGGAANEDAPALDV